MAAEAPVFQGPVESLLADVLDGHGRLVVLEGPGTGAAVASDDLRVVRVTSVEVESGLPYVTLADVMRPIVNLLGSIPERQAEALRAALALAAPGCDDRLAICAGALSLISAAAPVLLVIDEAQWIDTASVEPLLYACRRLDGLQIGVLLNVRAGLPTPFLRSPTDKPSVPDDPAQGLLDAAAAARSAGKPERALRLIDEALGCTDDPLVRADAHHMRGLVSMWRTAPAQASRELLTEASRVELLDPSKAACMTADAAWASFMAGDLDAGLAAAVKARELGAPQGGAVEVLAAALLAIAELLHGRSADAVPKLEHFLPLLDDRQFLEQSSNAVWPVALALVWLEKYTPAQDAFAALVDFARTRGRPTLLSHALIGLSELEFRTGDWTAARASATEAAHLADETGQPVAHAFALLALARVAAPQGREADCTAHVFEAVRLAPSGAGAVLAFAGTHLGSLELALGRSDATVSHLEQVAARAADLGLEDPGVVQWAPDLIEAYARCGRLDEAHAALDAYERRAHAAGRAWAVASAARCRGLVAPAADFEAAFAEARERHTLCPTPFDRARTELCYGERLRRARRRLDARAPLRTAAEIFSRLGAEPWAARAASELRATGETVRSGVDARSDELTPQEREIACLVARGATNREAAAALYLSAKTIETHLGRIYRKLHVRSRTELARLLA